MLKGFVKTPLLQPGGSHNVTFNLTAEDLSMWDVEQGAFIEVRGQYNATVGASSRDGRVSVPFTIPLTSRPSLEEAPEANA